MKIGDDEVKEETKRELHIALGILRQTCVDNNVSIAVNKETGALYFFDTETYLKENQYKGISVDLKELVKE